MQFCRKLFVDRDLCAHFAHSLVIIIHSIIIFLSRVHRRGFKQICNKERCVFGIAENLTTATWQTRACPCVGFNQAFFHEGSEGLTYAHMIYKTKEILRFFSEWNARKRDKTRESYLTNQREKEGESERNEMR